MERAYGVPDAHCVARTAASAPGAGGLRLGATAQSALLAAGQPASRPGRSYRYCVSGGGSAAMVFRSSGRTGLVVTTARGYRAGGHRVGQRVRGQRVVTNGITLGATHKGGWRYVYGVRRGRFTFVGVAARGSRGQILSDARAAGVF